MATATAPRDDKSLEQTKEDGRRSRHADRPEKPDGKDEAPPSIHADRPDNSDNERIRREEILQGKVATYYPEEQPAKAEDGK